MLHSRALRCLKERPSMGFQSSDQSYLPELSRVTTMWRRVTISSP